MASHLIRNRLPRFGHFDRVPRWPAIAVSLFLVMPGGCQNRTSEKTQPPNRIESAAVGTPQPPRRGKYTAETPNQVSNAGESTSYAVRFEEGQCLEIPDSSNLVDLNADFTIEMWVRFPNKPRDGEGRVSLAGNEVASDGETNVRPSANSATKGWVMRVRPVGIHLEWSFTVATNHAGWITTTTAPLSRPEGWRHVAVSKSSDQVRVFVDGKLEARQNVRDPLIASSTPIFLGPQASESKESRLTMDVRSFRISTNGRYAEAFQPESPLGNDARTAACFDFARGAGNDLVNQQRTGKFWGPTWVKADAPSPQEPAVADVVAPQEAPTPSGSPLQIARGLWARGANRGEEFQRALRDVRDQLPEIRIAPGQPTWTRVKLNTSGAKLDAIRFTSPLDEAADLRWVFAVPAESVSLRWNIAPLQGSMLGFRDLVLEKNLRLVGADLPTRNAVIFQELSSGEILPRQEYVIWFALVDSSPVEFHVMIKLVPAGTMPPFETSTEIARDLGLPLPFDFTIPPELDEELAWAARLAAGGKVSQAIEVAERARSQNPNNRHVVFLLAKLGLEKAIRLSDVDRSRANDFLFQSAKRMRDLREKHSEFNAPERAFWPTSLYNEACAYATTGDLEQAMVSLREALAAGFTDLATLEGDPDLAALRDAPEFESLVEELRKRPPAADR